MANATIKPATITRVGYEYQDLVGIEALIRFYRDPKSYNWVELEADKTDSSLDDVVVARSDGSLEYYQVKFTVDQTDYPLTWDWLLAKKPKGTSLLGKWAKSLTEVARQGPIRYASLRTNRIPDADVAACLKDTLLSLDLVPEETRLKLETECGGRAAALAFFAKFEFVHSARNFDAYESHLRDQLVPTDMEASGWLYLRERVRRWTTRRNEPRPDGRILHEHLTQVISRGRPEPIRQDFRVPVGYSVPSSTFHTSFSRRISDRKTPISIVWGTPGRGKSTYLSYLTDELRKSGAPVIRHHYFLADDDHTTDRMSFVAIAGSLINQLFVLYPEATGGSGDEYDKLQQIVSRAAEHFKAESKRLYIVMDGLDHVWRDTAKTDQLNHVFNALLPLADNVSLIVGTQRVPDNQLPIRLVRRAKPSDWIEIPPMDEVAVHTWVRAQDAAGRIILNGHKRGDRRDEQVSEIASSFYAISQGHPLHLIYAFESVTRNGAPISHDDVDRIPPCPDGDIRSYYGILWTGLTSAARDMLHMLAGSDFHWPSSGIRQIAGGYEEIDFLLAPRESGMVPFHASIFAYVREKPDHADAYQALLPRVTAWLETAAPAFWRWGWLWLSKARQGQYEDLMRGATRAWVVDSLAEGWPDQQIAAILGVAERKAFDDGDLPKTVELRLLKIRVLNGAEFQTSDSASFVAAAIQASSNWQQLRNLADNIQNLSRDEVSLLPAIAPADLREELGEAALRELARRINVWIELRHKSEQDFIALARLYLKAASHVGGDSVGRALRFILGFREPEDLVRFFVEWLGNADNLDGLIFVHGKLQAKKWDDVRPAIHDEIVRTCCAIGADLTARLPAPAEAIPPMSACWFRLHRPAIPHKMLIPVAAANLFRNDHRFGRDPGLESFFVNVFFSALATSLVAEGDHSYAYPGVPRGDIGWMRLAIDTLESTAKRVSIGELSSFTAPWLGAADVAELKHGPNTESDYLLYVSFRRALLKIALDLHLISADSATSQVSNAAFEIARASVHWSDEIWLAENVENQKAILDPGGAATLVREVAAKEAASVTQFHERCDRWVELARFCNLYEMRGSRDFMVRASECLMGYGYHKDLWAIDVLDAVREVHQAGARPALPFLRTLVPIINEITEFTDGDETDYARSEMIEVVAQTYPDRLPQFFRHYLDNDEWRYADETLQQFTHVQGFDSDFERALPETYLDHHTLYQLEKEAARSPAAASLHAAQVAFLGGEPVDRHERRRTSGKKMRKPRRDPTKLGPSDFAGLVKVVSGKVPYEHRKEFMGDWLRHWTDAGEGKQALASIEAYFENGGPTFNADDMLDDAFLASLRIEGKAKAYRWLVRAHVERSGWASYYHDEREVMARLKLAAKHYAPKWLDYVRDTAAHRGKWRRRESFAIGQRYLVRFLILAGQGEVAASVTETFVRVLTQEVSDLPPLEAPWFQ